MAAIAVDGDHAAHVEPFEHHVRVCATIVLNAHVRLCPICLVRGVRACGHGVLLLRYAEHGRGVPQ